MSLTSATRVIVGRTEANRTDSPEEDAMRIDARFSLTIMTVTLLLCGACRSSDEGSASGGIGMFQKRVSVPAGTALHVRLGSTMSTENVRPGEAWSGTLTRAVVVQDRE